MEYVHLLLFWLNFEEYVYFCQSFLLNIFSIKLFSIKHSIINNKWYFMMFLTLIKSWYSKSLQSYKDIYFHIQFYEIHVRFLLQKNECNSDNKNHRDIKMLFLLIAMIVFLLQDNVILLHLESLQDNYVCYGLSNVFKYRQDMFFLF